MPPAVEVEPLSVSAAERALGQLRARLADTEREIGEIEQRRLQLERAYFDGITRGANDVHRRHSALSEARDRLAERNARIPVLHRAIADAELALERAQAARAERERAHWKGVATQVAGAERWVARLLASAGPGTVTTWEETWGRKPTDGERVSIANDLRRRYPFRDADTPPASPKGTRLEAKILCVLEGGPLRTTQINTALNRRFRVAAVRQALEGPTQLKLRPDLIGSLV